MNLYIKIMLGLMLSNLSLFSSQNHSSEISNLEAQALQKLTQQLRTNTPANISPELTKLHEIAVHQAEEKTESLQKATTIFGAAAIGALLTKATERSSNQRFQHISYRSARTTAEAEATKMITGLEAPVIAALLPSGSSIFYGALAVGTLFVLYEFNKGLHAPCRAKFQLAEHHFDNQLQTMRSDIDHKQDELRNTLTTVQTENERITGSLLKAQQGIQGFKANQTKIQREIGTIGTTLSGIRSSLSLMSKKAHWDLRQFPQSVANAHAARENQQEQQAAAQQEQKLQEMIREAEIDVLVGELESKKTRDSARAIAPIAPQRSMHRTPQPLAAGAQEIGAGVRFVDKVGYFGCYPTTKKQPELR